MAGTPASCSVCVSFASIRSCSLRTNPTRVASALSTSRMARLRVTPEAPDSLAAVVALFVHSVSMADTLALKCSVASTISRPRAPAISPQEFRKVKRGMSLEEEEEEEEEEEDDDEEEVDGAIGRKRVALKTSILRACPSASASAAESTVRCGERGRSANGCHFVSAEERELL